MNTFTRTLRILSLTYDIVGIFLVAWLYASLLLFPQWGDIVWLQYLTAFWLVTIVGTYLVYLVLLLIVKYKTRNWY